MNRFVFVIFFALGTNAFGQIKSKITKSPREFVPAGYVLVEEIQGDLNGDKQRDCVFIIKGTSKGKLVKNEQGETVDRNRRGVIVVFGSQNGYECVLENRDCFSSENEDGGNYFAPELNVTVSKGNLCLHYGHGRYGYWTYTFRYQHSDFELIGYDRSEGRGPVVERSVSINLMTRKVRVRENVNPNAEGGDEEFKDRWKRFELPKPIRLREVADFDNLDIEKSLGLRD